MGKKSMHGKKIRRKRRGAAGDDVDGEELKLGGNYYYNNNWGGSLCEDVLGLIFDKVSLNDYMRCAVVCKLWYEYIRRSWMNKKQRLPLLLIPADGRSRRRRNLEDDYKSSWTHRILDNVINNTSTIGLCVPQTWNKRCCGSSHGWLIYYDEQQPDIVNPTFVDLTLFNPFTHATIHLPPLLLHHTLNFFMIKVVLSHHPCTSNGYELLALQLHGRISLFSSTRHTWIYAHNYFEDKEDYMIRDESDDIIYFNHKFHALIDGNIGSIDIIQQQDRTYVIRLQVFTKVDVKFLVKPYLAQSITGTLLYIERFPIQHQQVTDQRALRDWFIHNMQRETECLREARRKWCWRFRVYELVQEEEDGRRRIILKLNQFRDQALFLGDNNDSVSVRASDFPGCKPNSIYFTLYSKRFDEPYDVGLYTPGDDDDDDQVNPLYPRLINPYMPAPIWIQPRLNLT